MTMHAETVVAGVTDVRTESGIPDEAFLADVVGGLTARQKSIPPKYFYDRRGSALFEEITELEEYYLTRTEISILESKIDDIMLHLGRQVVLIEYGSGSSKKTRLILERLGGGSSYVPIDISAAYLLRVAEHLRSNYPHLDVLPVVADYSAPVDLPTADGTRYVFYPGSTIGNFEPNQSHEFLVRLRTAVGQNGGVLLGIDLKKDRARLESAYNDSQGVTAAFNLNLLDRINRELGSDFRPNAFEHRAPYNEAEGRVEMHLVSKCDQDVRLRDLVIHFRKGEYIHTENSYKFSLGDFEIRAAAAGFSVEEVWTDPDELFAVILLRTG